MRPARIAAGRESFSAILHLAMVLAFIPMVAFLISPRFLRADAPRMIVSVFTEMMGPGRDTPNPDATFEREAAMSPQALMRRWDGLIGDAAQRFGVSAAWIRAVMRQESGGRTVQAGDQPITSPAGAVGVMQLEPATYEEMRRQYGLGADPADPHDNVYAGAAYLKWLHGRYGYPGMFAAYNGGPGTYEDHVERGKPLPAETINYVQSVTAMLAVRDGPRRLRGSETGPG
ncbi:MAG: lytic transglycosylase domain-containing protein [Rhizomicrobium sp.]